MVEKEYKILKKRVYKAIKIAVDEEQLASEINQLTKQGWELVRIEQLWGQGTTIELLLFFSRQI